MSVDLVDLPKERVGEKCGKCGEDCNKDGKICLHCNKPFCGPKCGVAHFLSIPYNFVAPYSDMK